MAVDTTEVGARIREARLAHGWTHEELARRMGVNWRTVQRWQSGRLPSVATLVRLADVLGVPEAYLVDTDDAVTTVADLKARVEELTERVERLTKALEARETRSRPRKKR